MRSEFKRFLWLILLIFTLIFQPALAQKNEKYDAKIKKIEDYVNEQIKIDRITGISVGFMKDNFIWAKGFGYSDLENKTPAREESAYRLASITKTMTAVAILQLMEKGKINLDAEVQKYVPYFPRKRWPVTIRKLLGHLGGITHYRDYDTEGHIKVHKDTREALAIFQDFDLVAEPGTVFHYTSYGFNLLGAVVGSAAKRPFGEYVGKNIWQPMGMNNTHMESPDELLNGRVRGYRLINGKIKNSEYVDISSRFAGGGTRSTVVDLLKYSRGIIQGKLLSEKTLNMMFTSMATKKGFFTGYGMGWSILPINGRFCVGHGGGQAETRTFLMIFPKENFAIAVGCNFESGNPYKYAIRVYELIFNEIGDYAFRSIPVYTGNGIDDNILFAMNEVFNHGSSYYKQHQKLRTQNSGELASAFSFFNKTVSSDAFKSDLKKTFRKIREARHPKGNEKFIKIGSFMAMNLMKNKGPDNFDSYHKSGCITFFRDYIKMYKKTQGISEDFRFTKEFENMVQQWYQSWEKHADTIKDINISPNSNLGVLEKKLKRLSRDEKIYPDFIRQISNTVRYLCLMDKKAKAIRLSKLCVELYPESARSYMILAHTHLCFGSKKRAKEFYEKASKASIHKNSYNPRSFVYMADFLWNFGGSINRAVEFAKTGLGIFPESPRLNFYLGASYLEKAKIYLKKALEFDPNNRWAWKMLKKIK